MLNIKLILYIVLSLNVNLSISYDADDFDFADFRRCSETNVEDLSSTASKVCSSINSSFKRDTDQCCLIVMTIDTLQDLKKKYPENWKKKASEEYGFDENLSEEEIREKYVKNKRHNSCSLMTGDEDYRIYNLYMNSQFSYGGKISYDCGDGEKSFKTKDYIDYIPKQQKFKIVKDIVMCLRETNEANCHNAASKFLTEDVLACWNTANTFKDDLGYSDIEECRGYKISEYKSEFASIFTSELKGYQNYHRNPVEKTWKCVDKSGKKIQIYMNTKTGKLKFT